MDHEKLDANHVTEDTTLSCFYCEAPMSGKTCRKLAGYQACSVCIGRAQEVWVRTQRSAKVFQHLAVGVLIFIPLGVLADFAIAALGRLYWPMSAALGAVSVLYVAVVTPVYRRKAYRWVVVLVTYAGLAGLNAPVVLPLVSPEIEYTVRSLTAEEAKEKIAAARTVLCMRTRTRTG